MLRSVRVMVNKYLGSPVHLNKKNTLHDTEFRAIASDNGYWVCRVQALGLRVSAMLGLETVVCIWGLK